MRSLLPFLRLYQQQWRRLALGMALALLTLLASIGLLSLSGWFISATAVAGLVITRSVEFNYLMPAGAVRGFSVARTAFRWTERVVTHDATFRLLATLRSWFFRRLGQLRTQQLPKVRQADLLNRMVADIDAMDHVYLRLITPFIAGFLAITSVALLVGWFVPRAGIALFFLLLALLIILPLVFYRLGKIPGQKLGQHQMHLRQQLLDYLQGHNELRVFGAVKIQQQRLQQSEQQLLLQQEKMSHYSGAAQGLVILFNGWVMVGILVLTAQVLTAQAQLGPILALVVFATMASFEALAPVAGAFQHLSHTQSAADRLNEILTQESSLTFGQHAGFQHAALHLHQVDFAYAPIGQLHRPILSQLSLQLEAGSKTAIVGPTGCGKSTLLQLLTRELDPTSGQITINDTALNELSQEGLSNTLCVVSQRVHIFNDSLANNLRLAAPNASTEQLETVLKQVKLDKLLQGSGLSQWLGDGGRQLSGGERRRIGIARALLHPAPILLLDEPTEGLDDATELAIIEQLLAQQPERPVLYVTQKRAALSYMDRVMLMDNGQLTEIAPDSLTR